MALAAAGAQAAQQLVAGRLPGAASGLSRGQSAGFFAMAGKGGKKGKKKGPSEVQAPKPAAQKLTHSLDMINAFAALKAEPPPASLPVAAGLPGDVLQGSRPSHALPAQQTQRHAAGTLSRGC